MDELESQIAKIQLGGSKDASAYVFVMAEKAAGSEAELYVVAELPVLNPAAYESCERICLAIASTLKRAYKRSVNPNSFENAIAQVNDELGKLASLGQTQWIDKLNCVVGVKEGHNFNIASCGKVSAYLLRNEEFTDISCSQPRSHPLKTFENFASGKIRLGDLLLLSTTQLFNHISMDRLLTILGSGDFLTSAQTIIQILKDNADPQTAFGVILNLQVPPGQVQDEEIDLENYVVEDRQPSSSFLTKILDYAKNALTFLPKTKRKPTVSLPKVSLGDKIKSFGGNAKNFAQAGKNAWQAAKISAQAAKSAVSPQNIKQLPMAKKVLFISIIVLLLTVVINIVVAAKVKSGRALREQTYSKVKSVQDALANTQASILYKDDIKAAQFFQSAKEIFQTIAAVDDSNKEFYEKVKSQFTEAQAQLEKVVEVSVENLGSLGSAERLIKLPETLAAEVNGAIINYNKKDSKIQDSVLKSEAAIQSCAYLSGTLAGIYDGGKLYAWDFSAGQVSSGFINNVPAQEDFGGMAAYATNSRIYVADKKNGQIVNFALAKSGLSKPIVAVKEPSINQAIDISIDGSIYVLTPNGIIKFQNGKLADFSLPFMPAPFGGKGKIYTQKDFENIYLLDSVNKRILALNKAGSLVYTLQPKEFTDLKDLEVDEKNKVMYVLNDGSLLKISLP